MTRAAPGSYDGVNRLATGTEGSTTWTQSYAYDQWGNRGVTGYRPNNDLTPKATSEYNSNNRWYRGAGDVYDGGGNQTGVGSYSAPSLSASTFGYDAENRLTSENSNGMGTVQYVYDGNGRRIEKLINGGGRVYVYDALGALAAEYTTQAIASGTTGGTSYFTADALGSTRLVTGALGSYTPVKKRYDYLPFGEEIASGVGARTAALGYGSATYPTSPDVVSEKFTGKERDAESGLDYFGARYYGSNMGRFQSPDPSGMLAQKPQDPQSWNLYVYARNNPLINLDPTGLDCVYANDAGNGVESIDHNSSSGECGGSGGSWVPGYADENWAHFNNNTNMFQVGSVDGAGANATVDYTTFGAGDNTGFNASDTACSGCSGFASANANWLQGQLVGNSQLSGLDGYIQFLTGREQPLSTFSQFAFGPLDYKDNHWAGPGGFGPPGGTGDWKASVHDFNFNTNGITIGSYFNPSLSPATSRALIQSNNYLMQTGGYQGAKEKLFFGVVNAFQWLTHAF